MNQLKKYFLFIWFILMWGLAEAEIKPADGLWVTEDDPAIGSGLMLNTQNGITLISVFTYDNEGQNIWYIGSGQVDEAGILEAELQQTENGQNLLLENPLAASFVEQTQSVKIEFQGSQIAILRVGDSAPKMIQANHFGTASTFDFPDLTGKWVIASKNNGDSFVLNFGEAQINQGTVGVALPYLDVSFVSSHPSTENWRMECVVLRDQSSPSSCELVNAIEDIPELYVSASDIGTNFLSLRTYGGDSEYQGFRLNNDRRLFPNDGHWRPADDPENGSGLVLRTQGEYTVVVIYSYDENGKPKWQNAAGQFDQNGRLVAELVSPNNGTAIQSQTPQSAAFVGQPQTLEIQLEGLELATFSIDGSVPKYIQNFNFGHQLYTTENYTVNGQPLNFPDLIDVWVGVDHSNDYYIESHVVGIGEFSGVVSPRPPGEGLLYGTSSLSLLPAVSFTISFTCTRELLHSDSNPYFNSLPYCGGYYSQINDLGTENDFWSARVYFQDIGVNRFRVYVGPAENVSRNSAYVDFFRLQ